MEKIWKNSGKNSKNFGEIVEDFGLTFDIRSYQFHDDNGYTLNAEFVMMEDNYRIIDDIHAGTGVKVDDFFVDVLRDTIEINEPKFPW